MDRVSAEAKIPESEVQKRRAESGERRVAGAHHESWRYAK